MKNQPPTTHAIRRFFPRTGCDSSKSPGIQWANMHYSAELEFRFQGHFSNFAAPAARRHPVSSHPLATRVMRAFFLLVRSTSPRAPPRFDASPPRLYIVTRQRIFRRGHPRCRSGRVVLSSSRTRSRSRARPLADARSPRVVPPSLRPERVPPLPGSRHLWRFAARGSPTHAVAASSAARAPAIFSSIFAMRSSESSNASMCLT